MFTDISELLHHERGERLASMPRTGGTLLSAGCAGLWYFDWVKEMYGAVDRHIGIEFYSPRPEVLPKNVEWIENTVGDMKDVADRSVDTLFSGENLEHICGRRRLRQGVQGRRDHQGVSGRRRRLRCLV